LQNISLKELEFTRPVELRKHLFMTELERRWSWHRRHIFICV